jgi:hypothetical protein
MYALGGVGIGLNMVAAYVNLRQKNYPIVCISLICISWISYLLLP